LKACRRRAFFFVQVAVPASRATGATARCARYGRTRRGPASDGGGAGGFLQSRNLACKSRKRSASNDKEPTHERLLPTRPPDAQRGRAARREPDFAPDGLKARSHADYDASTDLRQMLSANLVAERIAVEAYRQMVDLIGDKDPTTRRMLEEILRDEEEHADELRDLLAT
jgi:hypothetical protein